MPQVTKEVSFKWIAIGASLIFGLNKLLQVVLEQPVAAPLIEKLSTTGLVIYILLIAFGSFFLGGLLVSWLSPGETIKEPAYASLLAILVNGTYNLITVQETIELSWFFWLAVTAGISFGLGLAGGWLGEKIQGDTTDKMRERGEFGRI